MRHLFSNASPQLSESERKRQRQIAQTRRWCVYGILAWGLAASGYFLVGAAVTGMVNMINTPPEGPRTLPLGAWLRVGVLAAPILPLLYWRFTCARRNTRVALHGAMGVALLGIALHFAVILYFVYGLGRP